MRYPRKNTEVEIESTEAELKHRRKKIRGKIETTEPKFKYPRKITESESWLMLHPVDSWYTFDPVSTILSRVCNREGQHEKMSIEGCVQIIWINT